jgi:hypothetical protein
MHVFGHIYLPITVPVLVKTDTLVYYVLSSMPYNIPQNPWYAPL